MRATRENHAALIEACECDACEANRERWINLARERDRLREALEFYADPATYFAWGMLGDSPCGDWGTDFEETYLGVKPGKRARAALEGGKP